MKKIILCTALLLAGMTLGSYARDSRGTSKQNTSVTVVSDTTANSDVDGTDDADDAANSSSLQAQIDSAVASRLGVDQDDWDNSDDDWAEKNIGPFGNKGESFVIWIIFIVFGFPVLLVAVILYFVYRNRKEKYELQKMAMEKRLDSNTIYDVGKSGGEQGINTTTETKDSNNVYSSISSNLPDSMTPNEVLWEKGVKQMCLGIGLALLFGFIIDAEFSVIGLLVFFMGLGKAIISKTRKNPVGDTDNFNINKRYNTTGKPASRTEDNVPDENKED